MATTRATSPGSDWLIPTDLLISLAEIRFFLLLKSDPHFYAVKGSNFGHYWTVLDQSQIDQALIEVELEF